MKPTRKNYYDADTQAEYRTNSQIGIGLRCVNLWHAQYIEQSYAPAHSPATQTAFLMGHLFENRLLRPETEAQFDNEHPGCFNKVTSEQVRENITALPEAAQRVLVEKFPELYVSRGKTKGELKAAIKITNDMRSWDPAVFAPRGPMKKEFQFVDEMVACAKRSPLICEHLQGDQEALVLGNIGGVNTMSLLDLLDHDNRRIVDIKTTKSIDELAWDDRLRRKVPNYEAFNYWRQMAFYREVVRQDTGELYDCYIVMVEKPTRERPNAKAILYEFSDENRLRYELAQIKLALNLMGNWQTVFHCRDCPVCRRDAVVEEVEVALDWLELDID